jgi:class 3 adenylate cyclase/TolB-like protein
MEAEGSFTRRVAAILLVDVSGYSAMMGEDDERTARAVHRMQQSIVDIVARFGGRAKPSAGDSVFALLDSVGSAVDAALSVQRFVCGEDFSGLAIRVRIGVHFGDVLMRGDEALGDAINVAARLMALAEPGTVCVSDGVYRQVRGKLAVRVVDLGRKTLKNISDPMRAYQIVPHEEAEPAVETKAGRSPWILCGGALAAALGVASLFVLPRGTSPRPASAPASVVHAARLPADRATAGGLAKTSAALVEADAPREVALGVMRFQLSGGPPGEEWRRDALRDGLNAQLSQLSRVKVYSKEFIDFLITRKGMTEIEAATELGIKKILSGSVVMVGRSLKIETHVVDVASGVLERSFETVGAADDFIALENRVVLETIARLDLPVSAEERSLLAARQNTSVDALKLLMEGEGGSVSRSEPVSAVPARSPFGRMPDGLVARAIAGEDPKTEILDLLERYRKATEARRVSGLSELYAEFTPEQAAAQERYFANARDLRVTIADVDLAVAEGEAVVSYTRTDDFVDAGSGRPVHVSIRLTKLVRQDESGAWKLSGAK